MKNHFKLLRLLVASFMALIAILVIIPSQALATTYNAPDISFQILALSAYKNCLVVGDEGYFISFSIGYTVPPAIPIDSAFLFSISDNATILKTTTAYGFHNNGYGIGVAQKGIAWIYFAPTETMPTWSGNITVAFDGNPTLTWNGGIPETTSTVFSIWFDGGSVAATTARLNTGFIYIANILQTDWGTMITQPLIQNVASGTVFTTAGEQFFTTTIPNLRTMCPALFYQEMTPANFPKGLLVLDYYIGQVFGGVDVYNTTQYAQTFIVGGDYGMTGVQIDCYKVGNPNTLTISLRNVVGGIPSGADLVSGDYNGNSIMTDIGGEWISVPFTADYPLVRGNTYAIVATAATGGVANKVVWLHNTSNGYANGTEVSNIGGGGWLAVPANDCMFELLVRGGKTLSLGERYKIQLLGTTFDLTQVGTNWGTDSITVLTLIWLAMSAVIVIVMMIATGGADFWWVLLNFMVTYGWRAGFCSTPVFIAIFIISAMLISYGLFLKRTY